MKKVDYSPLKKSSGFGGVFKFGQTIFAVQKIIIGLTLIVPLVIIVHWFSLFSAADFNSMVPLFIVVAVLIMLIASPSNPFRQVLVFYRISRLAQANGWLVGMHLRDFSGLIFQYDNQIFLKPIISVPANNLFDGQNPFDFGNHSFKQGDSVAKYGFVCVKLSRHLPHILLDGRSNNLLSRFSNLPASYRRDQLVELAGGFDKHFKTYVPKDYERDALEILTIDLMSDLVEYGANYDFEIIDDELYIYSSPGFDLSNPEQYERIFRLVQVVAEKLDKRAGRYDDHRIAGQLGDIASVGRRLK